MGSRHRPGWASLLAGLTALALAGCLPASIRPSQTPGPTPVPAATPSPTASPTAGPPTPTPAPTFATYVVVRNDSLLGIAKKFGTTARSIAYWNRRTYPTLDPEAAGYDPNRLQAGWVLRILPGREYERPLDEGESPDPEPSVTPTPGGSGGTEPSGDPGASF